MEMKKVTWMLICGFLLYGSSMDGAVLQIEKGSVGASAEEVGILRELIMQRNHFVPSSDKDVEKIIIDNKKLSNAFVDCCWPERKVELEVELNELLAKKYIRYIQAQVKIPDDIAKSYYLDNIEKYKYGPTAKLDIYTFDKLEDAFETYQKLESLPLKKALALLREKKVESYPYSGPLKFMYPHIRAALKNKKDKDYFTPPQFDGGKFILIYVKELDEDDHYVEYEKVKQSIVRELHKKTYLRMRDEALKKYDEK